ncbi:hypothetical protein F4802DRAFT_574343 [Xylaria palmicola]|nr:hypothetical protein F4802DRAFT_574343 [Xylaria palmicola]
MVFQDTPIRDMNAEVLNKVLRTKGYEQQAPGGATATGRATRLAVFFSSVASVLADVGQSEYTAVNLFHKRRGIS